MKKIDMLIHLSGTSRRLLPFASLLILIIAGLLGCLSIYSARAFSEAPLYIVVCADEAVSWKRSSDGRDHADVDAAIAAEHICLAAAQQGLGSCWVCNFDLPACREALQLPENLRPVVLVPIGYAADVPAQKKRKLLSEIVEYR